MSDDRTRGLELISLSRRTKGLEDLPAEFVEQEISPLELASLAATLVPHSGGIKSAVKNALDLYEESKRLLEREGWIESLRLKAQAVEAACDAFERVHGPFPVSFATVAHLAGWETKSGANKGKIDSRKAKKALEVPFREVSKGPGKGRVERRSFLRYDSLKTGVERGDLEVLIRNVLEIREYAFDLIEKN